MNFDFSLVTANATVIVPVIIALVQAVKLTGWVKDHFAPLVAIGFGIAVAFLGYDQTSTITNVIFAGALYGLMGSGLYSGVKTTMQANARMKAERQEKKRKNSADPF